MARNKGEKITPYGTCGDTRGKAEQVEAMFDSIAPAYDAMNTAMTFGLHRRWLARAVRTVVAAEPTLILDVATGTADVAIALAKSLPKAHITGIDLSQGMLDRGAVKVEAAGLSDRIALQVADCLELPFADNSFDAVTVAYGVRNFDRLDRGYSEMLRVLRPGGLLCVLELSVPVNPVVRPFYRLYTRCVIPVVGKLVSHDHRAYTYLPESIAAATQGTAMLELMQQVGFDDCHLRRLAPGVCTLYTALKPKNHSPQPK